MSKVLYVEMLMYIIHVYVIIYFVLVRLCSDCPNPDHYPDSNCQANTRPPAVFMCPVPRRAAEPQIEFNSFI